MTRDAGNSSPADRPRPVRHRRDDEPVLPDVTRDERDRGWGDDLDGRSGERDDDWYRRERPPHHG